MKEFFLLIVFVGTLGFMTAQRNEVGISIGAANVIGDIGRSDYIQTPFPDDLSRAPISLGVLYRYNLNERQSIRLNFVYNRLFFNDEKADEDYRYNRNAMGDNTIIEFSGLFEYNFFDFNSEKRYASTPYIFGGVALYGYDDKSYLIEHKLFRNSAGRPIPPSEAGFKTDVTESIETKFGFSIPFGVGYKFKIKYNWVLGLEVGARYTFQNNLDYSNVNSDKFTVNVNDNILNSYPYSGDVAESTRDIIGKHQTGTNGNDWYLVYGINLTYTFGRPPCYCY